MFDTDLFVLRKLVAAGGDYLNRSEFGPTPCISQIYPKKR
jgi:hypothetical protein